MRLPIIYSESTILELINRSKYLFIEDFENNKKYIENEIKKSKFLILGGAGSIGSATVKQIFIRKPKVLHVVDVSENNLAELVRDLRSSYGYIPGEFKTFCIDVGSDIFEKFYEDFKYYDYVLNFTALKHVRSEKDPYTIMRMIEVNVLNVIKSLNLATKFKNRKFFCVSTDKASNPVNLMGATKRVMEKFLITYIDNIDISSARFANVAFSDGSLLYSFLMRLQKKQPIVAPNDVKRYFITPAESGLLCMLSSILGHNMEIFYPKLIPSKHMLTFWEIAVKLLKLIGYEPYICESEDEARSRIQELVTKGQWPCLISKTDTAGEKEYEEFFTKDDKIDTSKFLDIGIIINNDRTSDLIRLVNTFLSDIQNFRINKNWSKIDIVNIIKKVIPEFNHHETGKYLDDKM